VDLETLRLRRTELLDWTGVHRRVEASCDEPMPPLPGTEWVTSVGNTLRSFLGGPESTVAGSHESQSEGMNGGVAGRTSAGLGKRVRDSSEQKSPNNKKQKMYGEDEGRLAGHYNDKMPKDARPIGVPGPNDRMNKEPSAGAKKSQTNPARSKPGAGFGHKTHNNIHALQAGRVGNPRAPKFQPSRPFVPSGQVRNVPRGAALDNDIGDGFSSSPSKRRKTNGAPKPSNQQIPVEVLSDDDDDDVREVNGVHAVNGRPVSSNSTSAPIEIDSQSQSQSTDYFAAREQRSINQHIVSGPQNKRRQKSSGQNTPSVSSIAPNERRGADLSGYDDPATPYLPDRMKSSARVDVKKNNILPHPSTTLGQGVDDDFGVEGMQRRKEDHSLRKMNDSLNHLSGKSTKPVLAKDERSADKAMEQRTPRQARPAQAPNSTEHEQRLQGQFKRDTETTPQQQPHHQQRERRQSLVNKMQAISNNGKADTIQDSPDQLQGGNTMIHRRQTQRVQSRTVAGSPARRRSPLDLVPANFITSAQKPARSMHPVQIAEKANEDEVRIPLKAIFCRGCVLDTKAMDDTASLDLVYRMDHALFLVELNGQPYYIPGSKEYMAVGKHEASKWHGGKHSNQVVLKGSASDRSNGTILLSFADEEGMHECHSWLLVASADTMTTKNEGKERIEKIFQNQTVPVQVDADKYAQQARSKSKTGMMQAQTDSGIHAEKQLTMDDEIVYEQRDGREERQPSARSRMQDSTDRISSQLQPSPYFTAERNRVSRKSTRQSKPVVERTPTPPPAPPRWTETHELEPWHQPVMFPTTGARRTAVDFQDIERLDEGEFLNDNLVGYALRRIEEDMAPEHKSKVHFFNSYFFTSLTSKNGRKAFNYDAVKKWTKQKDLFDTPYIVVPINENLHWFVAIICNLPNLVRKPALLGDEAADVAETPVTSQRSSVQPSPIRDPDDEVPDSQGSAKPDEQAMRQLSLDESEKGKATGGEVYEFDENKNLVGLVSEPHRDGESTQKNGKQHDKKSRKRAAPSLRKYPTDKPTIITLDSFGVGHPGQVSTLKKYVEAEALDKRGMNAAAASIQGMTATGMPVQSNYCDCGLYLVGYVEEFAKDPEGFVNKVLSRQLDQDSDFASFDPSAKRAELRDDLLKLHEEQDQARIALKKAKKEEKLKVKVGATAVTAQTSATSATSKHPSPAPAPPQPSAKQSAKAQSPLKTPPTSEELAHPRHALGNQHESSRVRPDPTVNDMESSVRGTRGSGHASDDEGLDEVPAKPYVSGRSRGLSAVNAQNSVLKQNASHAGSSAEDEDDGEMLDGLDGAADAKEEYIVRNFAQRRNGHKVTSPEVDELKNVLSQESLSAKKGS
jgi:sentrin-specific protease 7